MRRILTASLLIGLATVVVVGGWVVWPRSSAICKENYHRITVGMSLSQVEDILGGPARDESFGTLLVQVNDTPSAKDSPLKGEQQRFFRRSVLRREGVSSKEWISNQAAVWVGFDAEGSAVSRSFLVVYREPQWDDILRWFGFIDGASACAA